ncbi:hypothetical protein D3C78_1233520 [compost metagenome]
MVVALDAELLVEGEAVAAAAFPVGLDPLGGVVGVFGLMALRLFARRLQDVAAQRLADLAADHVDAPGLDVVAAGRTGGDLEDVADHLRGYSRGQEAAYRLAGLDGVIDVHADVPRYG